MDNTQTLKMFSKEFILFDLEADNKEELLNQLAGKLYNAGYVKDTYADAVLERENVFPTGLPTAGVKVAIPHTYAIHVNKPIIVVASLKKPVAFKEMGNGINDVMAELVFMLAVTDPKNEVTLLQKLMNIFTKENVLLELKASSDVDTTLNILQRELQ